MIRGGGFLDSRKKQRYHYIMKYGITIQLYPSLTAFAIPPNVTSIGDSVFSGCTSLSFTKWSEAYVQYDTTSISSTSLANTATAAKLLQEAGKSDRLTRN